MLNIFGLTLPTPTSRAERELAAALAGQMQAAAADVRHDTQRYLAARRNGELRFDGGSGRACDEGALALMRLTVDAPAVRAMPQPLVA
jgi:hypothetical protein